MGAKGTQLYTSTISTTTATRCYDHTFAVAFQPLYICMSCGMV